MWYGCLSEKERERVSSSIEQIEAVCEICPKNKDDGKIIIICYKIWFQTCWKQKTIFMKSGWLQSYEIL